MSPVPSFTVARGSSVQYNESSTQTVIGAAYRQVFGRDLYDGQGLKVSEIRLENGDITMREFIRDLAKSEIFRKMYWTSLYVCKSVEFIHRRLGSSDLRSSRDEPLL